MLLSEYLTLLEGASLVTESNISSDKSVEYISYSSLDVKADTLFICKGAHFKEEFLSQASKTGATCYVSEVKYPDVECDYIIVNDIRSAMGYIVNAFYNNIWKKLKMIGITGTKGKSTTAYFVKYILDDYLTELKKPLSAIVSSIDTYDGIESFESHLTTPEPLDLHRHFANAVKSNIDYLTMEVSSQALKYGRVFGIRYNVGCYLNIGDDHISDIEHPDFEDYFSSKLKLMSISDTACICLDSLETPRVIESAKSCGDVITFSTITPDANVFAKNIGKRDENTCFELVVDGISRGEYELTIPGLFNVQNALAAVSICIALKIPFEHIKTGLRKAQSKGRMNIFKNSDGSVIAIVDYAHNKMSFESLFNSVIAEFPGRKIYTVFGCPGKKAFRRREDLGKIAGMYSEKVFITEEDPGEEPIMKICADIKTHVDSVGGTAVIVPNRGEAIKRAIMSEGPSLVLITGKGVETRQKRGLQYIPCPSDAEYVKEHLGIE